MEKYLLFLYFAFLGTTASAQSFKKIPITDFSRQQNNSNSTSWGDFDNDGDLDLFITNGESDQDNEFYINEGYGSFRAVSNNLTSKKYPSFSSAWGDYDNDGWLDLYVANADYKNSAGERNFLFKNNGDGTFERIQNNSLVGSKDPSYGCAWADYDNDGWLDLYVVNAYGFRNRLYKNNGDGSFTEITDDPVVADSKHEISCSWSDYDNDGDVDLFVINTDPGSLNSFFENNGNGTFSKINNALSSRYFTKCRGSNWGDFNNDGWMDVVIIDSQGGKDILFRNTGNGDFVEVSSLDFNASADFSGEASAWGDFENDGDLDLILTHYFDNEPEFHINDGQGRFEKIQNEWNIPRQGFAWSLTSIDVNSDGRLDIFQSNRYTGDETGNAEENMLFLNTTSGCNSFAFVSLKGTISNTFGLGARIDVYGTNDNGISVRQKREMSCLSGGGYTSQSGNILHFGLSQYEQIDSIKVDWPSGISTTYKELPLDLHYKLIEDGSLEIVPIQNKSPFITIRKTTCPYNVEKLIVRDQYIPVTWYKNGEQFSNEFEIKIPFEQGDHWYFTEDECGNRDSILISNDFIEGKMFPNPASDIVNFVITGKHESSKAQIRLYDSTGRFLWEYEIELENGFSEKQINVENLMSGTYLVEITSECWTSVEKLVVISSD